MPSLSPRRFPICAFALSFACTDSADPGPVPDPLSDGDGNEDSAGSGNVDSGGPANADAGGSGNVDSGAADASTRDITNAVFESRDPDCARHAGQFRARVRDLGRSVDYVAEVSITEGTDACRLSSNSIPNHDFNDSGRFASAAKEVVEAFSIPRNPSAARDSTALSLQYDNAVFLNGVKLDLLAAACYGVGNEPLGKERIGCFETDTPWRYDPMHAKNNFGTDGHNAHTQPDGAYHYHGDPGAMYDPSASKASGLIGFAADGFPIFGPYIEDGGQVRRVRSSYVLKEGARVSQAGEGAFPGGDYDGTYVDDFEWREGAGDLDICNGMTVDGAYGYYVTDSFPWVMRCFRGQPDASFRKM